MSESDLQRAAGAVLVGGFPGEEIHDEFRALVAEGIVGGAILFARNIGTLEQAARLASQLRSLPAPEPLLLAIDQEGGRVQRLLAPFPELPPMRAVGETRRKTIARRAGVLIGESLSMVGFTQNYAPVLDVDSNPNNPVIGNRSFSRDPAMVARLGAAYIDGLQSTGLAACGKHFPGHGDTNQDSHYVLPRLDHDRRRLEEIELVPFRAAVRAGVGAIMTAHIMFPAFDRDHPATLSEHVIKALLRDDLGYDGVIVSDDLEMKAIADNYGIEDAAVRAIRAGCDQLLICHQPKLVRQAHAAIIEAVRKGSLDRARLFEAAERVRRLKAAFPGASVRPDPSELAGRFNREEHRAILADIGRGPHAPIAQDGSGSGREIAEYELEDDADETLELDESEV